MFKKTSLALAVAGLAFAGNSMAAPSVNISGFVDLGLEYYSGDGTGLIAQGFNSPQSNTDERNLAMNNPVVSRFIVSGSEEHANGWTTGYRIEQEVNALDDGGASFNTRQGYISLSKDKHNITIGSQWSPLFEYSAWNSMKSEGHGYGAYYFTACELPGSLSCGFRNDSTINYTYGGGGYSTDPFTFTVAAHINEDGRVLEDVNGNPIKDADGNEQTMNDAGITGMSIGGAASFGPATVNFAYIQSIVTESDVAKANGGLAAPSLMSVGAKYRAAEELELGFNYQTVDKDDGTDDERTSMSFGGMYNVAPDLSVHAGYGFGEDDNGAELESNIYAQVIKNISDTFHVRLELEQVSTKNSGDDSVAVVYLRQSF
ncbi:porin [Bermanella marisrubri]|uniref:Outer membrane protein (Porin) n=1 Tax=Bermanella marisrubri TaxID=207949 RepID=Q1MYK0_9GAMM|nr:porin [Bermanella marisrubri]EAT11031.1 outer membrane protein (porin) [Oceanobacter sp. RED65] [Bermanella marisrubri]QIZ82981.1 porin [Bermanella marisrubri]